MQVPRTMTPSDPARAAKIARYCPSCGHEAQWHKLDGRKKGGTPRFCCIAGIGGQFEAMEFCECDESPTAAIRARGTNESLAAR